MYRLIRRLAALFRVFDVERAISRKKIGFGLKAINSLITTRFL